MHHSCDVGCREVVLSLSSLVRCARCVRRELSSFCSSNNSSSNKSQQPQRQWSPTPGPHPRASNPLGFLIRRRINPPPSSEIPSSLARISHTSAARPCVRASGRRFIPFADPPCGHRPLQITLARFSTTKTTTECWNPPSASTSRTRRISNPS